eukprot:2288043-Amphidinium_carterae.1
MYNANEYTNITSEDVHFADVSWESMFEHLWPMELNYFSLTWRERKEFVTEQHQSESMSAREMMYYIELYGINDKGRRAKAQHLRAWALDCLWAEVRARINRVDSIATKKLISDNKLEAVLNKEYAKFRPAMPIHGVEDDVDFGNIFESAGTISVLMRNLRIIRRILIALIGKLNEAEAEQFWKWEPGFGYHHDGRITREAQTITFKATVASSPMEMNTPRVYYDNLQDSPSGVKRVIGTRGRALSVGSLNKPRSPMPQRTNSRSRPSRQAGGASRGESLGPTSKDGGLPSTSGAPTQLGPESSERSRSARRQKAGEASAIPEGEEIQQDHDFVDDIDFALDEAVPEGIEEQEEETFNDDDDEDVQYLYADRPDAMEERVTVDYSKIQSSQAWPRRIEDQPPWWERIAKYKQTGGITKAMCENRKTWDTMVAGARDPGYVGMNLPIEFKPKPNKGRNIAHD